MSKLVNDFIYKFPDIINNELCEKLINFFHKVEINISNDLVKTEINKNQNVNCINIELGSKFKYLNLSEELESERKSLNIKIHNIMEKIASKLYFKHKIATRNDSGYCLRKIYGPTKLHKDGINDNPGKSIHPNKIRTISIILCLNDGHDCEINFPKQNRKIKMKKGEGIAFPPFWTHEHEVNGPKKDTFRYTINTWFFE